MDSIFAEALARFQYAAACSEALAVDIRGMLGPDVTPTVRDNSIFFSEEDENLITDAQQMRAREFFTRPRIAPPRAPRFTPEELAIADGWPIS